MESRQSGAPVDEEASALSVAARARLESFDRVAPRFYLVTIGVNLLAVSVIGSVCFYAWSSF
jgi:hypothetical protein